jgi:DNA-binding XRE family transcriptional regulator
MNPSFGALVKHRRQMLGYSQAYLADRIRAEGQAIDVFLLERGDVTPSDRASLRALANALQWPVAMVEAATRMFNAQAGEGFASEQEMMGFAALPSAETMLEELEGLEQVHVVLEEWAMDLARRFDRLRSRQPGLSDDLYDL